MYKKILLLILIATSGGACADAELQKSVEEFCELYNPESWSGLGESASTQEIYSHILKAQQEVVRNQELKQAIASADTTDFASYYYSVKQNVESLLGKSWECTYFDQFYLPQQKVIQLTLGEATKKRINPQDKNTLVVMLTSDGTVLINNAPLQSAEASVVEAALRSRLQGTDVAKVHVVAYFDAGADGSRVAGLLKALAATGIKEVDLVDYP